MPRTILQPGPPAPHRVQAVAAGIVPIGQTLPSGPRLVDALAVLLEQHAIESACLQLLGGAFGPFGYVIPSLSPDTAHAAYYSDTFRPPGASALDVAALTLGYREGQPFFHCHALWTEADGRRGCGHVLPEETYIQAPITVVGAGIIGARFQVHADLETGFNLFAPYATGTALPPDALRGIAVRLAPNQDLIGALEQTAASAGFARAVVHGGVASIIGARFIDSPPIEGFATELLVRHGIVGGGSELDAAIVDFHGAIGTGRLVAGDNPVLMTFEGLLAEA